MSQTTVGQSSNVPVMLTNEQRKHLVDALGVYKTKVFNDNTSLPSGMTMESFQSMLGEMYQQLCRPDSSVDLTITAEHERILLAALNVFQNKIEEVMDWEVMSNQMTTEDATQMTDDIDRLYQTIRQHS